MPYAPFVEALRELTRSAEPGRLAALLGPARDGPDGCSPRWVVRREGPGGERPRPPIPMEADRAGQARLFEAVLTVLERLAHNGPIVLAIEDIQWADVGTRSLIAFLSRNLRHQPVVLLVTVRTDDPDPLVPTTRLLGELERQSWVERIEPDHSGARRWRACCGVQRRWWSRRRSLTVSWHGREATRSSSSSSRRRMRRAGGSAAAARPARRAGRPTRRVAERTRQVLRGAAAAGRRVDEELLAEVLGLTVPVVAEALRPAVAHGVLVDAGPMGGGYAFHHALLAEVAYSELLQGERAPPPRGVRPRTGTTR